MLRSLQDLETYDIGATDGQIGHVTDFYFDDDAWVVRYLVVDAGSWLTQRKVLISPLSIRQADAADRLLALNLTRAQVKDSPDIDTDQPVSRQQESDYNAYYGYPMYWGGGGMWGEGLYPYAMLPDYPGYGADSAERQREAAAYTAARRERHRHDDPHLRSSKEVEGYHVHASDGDIGHVQGLIVDEHTWAIRYLVIDTSNWWLGHKVLVAPEWITGVHWSDGSLSVALTRDAVKHAPPFDSIGTLNRQHETELYAHHRRDGYWAGGVRLETEV